MSDALKKLLVESRPKRPGARTDLVDNINQVKTNTPKGTSRAYLEDRLARDFPEHWKGWQIFHPRSHLPRACEMEPCDVAGFTR
jgi:hypothetical protein